MTGDKELSKDNASVAVVGKDHPLEIIEGEALQRYLDAIEVEGDTGDSAGGASAGGDAMELASEGESMSMS
jgi:20S proteasome subunit alpha 6